MDCREGLPSNRLREQLFQTRTLLDEASRVASVKWTHLWTLAVTTTTSLTFNVISGLTAGIAEPPRHPLRRFRRTWAVSATLGRSKCSAGPR
eukprot:9500365-Pyramimonas_sp.AAC.1